MEWADEVLAFWFGLEAEQWWSVDEALDAVIRERYLDLWNDERERPAEAFLGSAKAALAAIILFDQFPRNMFRGHADSFASDPLALAIARAAVDQALDEEVPAERRGFFYMPFEHSEDLDDQRRSVQLFTRLGKAELLHFAKLHHDVIERFGRFPHRNAILGRAPRPAEVEAGDVTPW
jgi:uncharacterized protein (DUF924 family)